MYSANVRTKHIACNDGKSPFHFTTLEMLIFVSLLINNVLMMMSSSSACPFSNGVEDVVAVSNVYIHTLDSVKERSSSYCTTIAVVRTKSNLRKKMK